MDEWISNDFRRRTGLQVQDRTATGVSNNDLMMLNGEGPDSSQDGKCFETAIVVEC